MPRQTKTITIKSGRDKGKRFKIVESDAFNASRLAWDLLCDVNLDLINLDMVAGAKALMSSPKRTAEDVEAVRDAIIQTGFAGLATIGLFDLMKALSSDCRDQLLDFLMGCCYWIDGTDDVPLSDCKGQIEEFLTFQTLQIETFALHINFLKAVA